ncbi:MAG: hypothetical protein M3068_11260 [Gemmatimonadota bacterium]|nr:hypothetical protein [Gemmatimonadota bacterium]
MGCPPKAPPLRGSVAPVSLRLPPDELPPGGGHRKMVFTWHYTDPDFDLHGDGAARIAAPDSVRLDFFLPNGLGGRAVVIGSEVRTPGIELVKGLVPPPPFLWGTLGQLRLGPARDTVVRVDADTVRADIGSDPRWRAVWVTGRLRSLELIEGGRVAQRVTRAAMDTVHFTDLRARRTLRLIVTRTESVDGFDEAIWR